MHRSGEALGAGYRLVEKLGGGAVGEVWRVHGGDGVPDLAAKILRPELAADTGIVDSLLRERTVLLGLRHPSIIAIRDLVAEGGTLALLMDLVPGGSLRDLLTAGGPLPAADVVTIVAEVCDALAAAHAHGIVHRDIKPDNVLLDRRGEPGLVGAVRVSDFGIAEVTSERLRHTTGLIGTPEYMPPELLVHGEIGPPGDVYAAGVVLYELLSGRTPFAGAGTDLSIAYRHVEAAPPPLAVPPRLWDLVAGLLDKDPVRRPTAAIAAEVLRSEIAALSGIAALPALPSPENFEAVSRPETMVRGVSVASLEHAIVPVPVASQVAPELGEADGLTIVRSQPRPVEVAPERTSRRPRFQRPDWLTRRVLLLGSVGIGVIAAMTIALVVLPHGGSAGGSAAVAASANVQDSPLPSGLTLGREARSDPATGEVELTLTFGAQKAELSGELFVVVPGTSNSAPCPHVTWSGITAEPNHPTTTGVSTECGWTLTPSPVSAEQSQTATARVTLDIGDEAALRDWLSASATATTTAMSDPNVSGTAYAVQRLREVRVHTPPRVVTQTTVPVTLVPVWPSGDDEVNPLYTSPSTGAPSSVLTAIAGGEKGVRFSDGCAGGLNVSGDGLVVTALTISPSCVLRADIGNFIAVQSAPFPITARDGG